MSLSPNMIKALKDLNALPPNDRYMKLDARTSRALWSRDLVKPHADWNLRSLGYVTITPSGRRALWKSEKTR